MEYKRADFGPEKANLGPEKVDKGPERADLGCERADLGPERADLGPKRADLRPERAYLRSKRGLSSLGGGHTDGRMDVWKFTPVSYRTSALWGRCPKRKKSALLI